MSCEYVLSLLGITAGTYFWMWYLVYEYEVAKGIRKTGTAWWNMDVRLPKPAGILVVSILLLSLWGTVAIVSAVWGHESAPVAVPTWSPPEIAQCDQELYERITEGCDEQ